MRKKKAKSAKAIAKDFAKNSVDDFMEQAAKEQAAASTTVAEIIHQGAPEATLYTLNVGVKQGGLEWYTLRYARVTMSEGITTLLDGGIIAKNNLLRTIHARRLHSDDTIRAEWESDQQRSRTNPNLAHGHDGEGRAVAYYEMTRGVSVQRPGFLIHPKYPWCGASLDFLEKTGEGLCVGEIKCPANPENHLRNLFYKEVPLIYYNQIQGCIEVAGADYGKFLSFDDRQPIDSNVLCVIPVKRDEAWQARFSAAADEFDTHLRNGTFYEQKFTKATDGLPSMF